MGSHRETTASRNRNRQANYAQTQGAEHTGRRWQPREDAAILADERPTDRELAETLGRSVQAIQARRAWYRRQGVTTYAVFHMTDDDVYQVAGTADVATGSQPLAYDEHEDTLFEGFEPLPLLEHPELDSDRLSAGRRFTARVLFDVHRGIHPLMRTQLHPEASRDASSTDPRHLPFTCGTCTNRDVGGYPKCLIGPQSHSVTTDVRAWWPACPQYQPIPEETDHV
jgi:hypothetical protein